MSLPRAGWAEMDAEQDWWCDLVAVCRELVEQARGKRVAGVTVSGLGPCLLCATPTSTRCVRRSFVVDMRATEEIAEPTERYGVDALIERCGKHLSSQSIGPKLLWVRNREPDVYERAQRWYSSHSFAVARVAGEHLLDHATASECDPFYDIVSKT